MDRRRYLAGIPGLTAAIAGCSRNRGETDDHPGDLSRPDSETWRYVNVLEYGADPTGEECVTPVLEDIIDSHGGDELLILFPPGTYRVDEGFVHDSFQSFGMAGFNATIEVSSGFQGAGIYDDKVFALGQSMGVAGDDVYVGGFEFDFENVSGSGEPPAAAVATYARGSLTLERLRTVGEPGQNRRMIELISDDCRARIHDCVVEGGPGAGIYIETDRHSSVTITDCVVRGCGDNGFYCSNGSVVMENCIAINNEISNVRVGGTVRESSVFVTDSDLENARGFWLRDGECRLENCFGYNDARETRAVLEVATSATSVMIDGSRFGTDSDQRIAIVDGRTRSDEHSVTFRKCTFFGENDGDDRDETIYVTRDRTAFLECSCSLTGDTRPIRFGGEAENCRVIDGRYVSARPIVFASGRGGIVRDVELATDDSDEQLDVRIPDMVVENAPVEIAEDVRTVVNGVGDNGRADPADGGDWNGHGREGTLVTWTDPSTDEERMSVYRNGDWRSWGLE